MPDISEVITALGAIEKKLNGLEDARAKEGANLSDIEKENGVSRRRAGQIGSSASRYGTAQHGEARWRSEEADAW